MGGLESIPVRIDPGDTSGLTGNAWPVVSEIAALAGRLATTGAPGAIDVRALPLSPADRAWLRETLGRGEVNATIEAAGLSSIEETGFPCVWWVTHRSATGQVVAELIEVATAPEIVVGARAEAGPGAARLAAIAAAAKETRA